MLPVRHMPVGGVGKEELPLGGHRRLDVLPPVNVLLRPVHHANIPSPAIQLLHLASSAVRIIYTYTVYTDLLSYVVFYPTTYLLVVRGGIKGGREQGNRRPPPEPIFKFFVPKFR